MLGDWTVLGDIVTGVCGRDPCIQSVPVTPLPGVMGVPLSLPDTMTVVTALSPPTWSLPAWNSVGGQGWIF